jgi:uncharacterized DUF497 family protein
MARDYRILWDLDDDPEGNVQHLAEHGLTPDDFEHALMHAVGFDESESSDREIAFGPALDGRMIAAVYDEIDGDTIRPVTAYYVEE